MEQETDYILREVNKITLLISHLISQFSKLSNSEIERGIREVDDLIKRKWDFSLLEITTYSEVEFINRLKELPEVHLEKLAELLGEIINHINTPELERKYDKKELRNKGILLIDHINKKSKVYSMKRMEIKNRLQTYNIK